MASYDTAPTIPKSTNDTRWVSSADITPPADSAWTYVSNPAPSDATSEPYRPAIRLVQNVTGASVMPGLGPPAGAHSVASPQPIKPLPAMVTQRVTVAGRWEGVVTETLPDLFVASVTPTDASEMGAFVAEITVSRVSDDDQPLIREGAPFYLTLGYRDDGAGRRSQISMVRFRRVPTWTRTDEVGWLERGELRRRRVGVYAEEAEEAGT